MKLLFKLKVEIYSGNPCIKFNNNTDCLPKEYNSYEEAEKDIPIILDDYKFLYRENLPSKYEVQYTFNISIHKFFQYTFNITPDGDTQNK